MYLMEFHLVHTDKENYAYYYISLNCKGNLKYISVGVIVQEPGIHSLCRTWKRIEIKSLAKKKGKKGRVR